MHILAPSPFFAGQFETPNHRQCELENSVISTGEGYVEERQVKILSEEVFYNKEYKSHRVLIIDSPFEGGTRVTVLNNAAAPSDDLIPVAERNAAVLSEWLQGLAGEVLHHIDASIRKFNRTYEIIEGFETEAARRLEDQCFNAKSWVFGTDKAQEFASQSAAHTELIEEAVEGYVMRGVHSKVWSSLEEIYAGQDARLQEICDRIGGITLKELGLRDELCLEHGIPEAEGHLSEMTKHAVPRDKLRCVQRATTALTSTLEAHLASRGLTDTKYALTTDDVLPLLIYAIIRANIVHQVTCSRYLSYFNASSISTSELGFHLANYQAAVEYLGEDKLVASSPRREEPRPLGTGGAEGQFPTSLSASPDEDSMHDSLSTAEEASPWHHDDSPEAGRAEGDSPPIPQLLTDLLPELRSSETIDSSLRRDSALGSQQRPDKVPRASAEFVPMQLTVSPTAASAPTGKDEDLGDFLESLREEGSTSLSSHQWGCS